MLGDLNAEPSKIPASRGMMRKNGWTDLGGKVDGWGSEANVPTCHARAGVKETRIDLAVASREALPLVRGFEVQGDMMIPTHKVVRVAISRKQLLKPKRMAKKLTSLRALFEKKTEKHI